MLKLTIQIIAKHIHLKCLTFFLLTQLVMPVLASANLDASLEEMFKAEKYQDIISLVSQKSSEKTVEDYFYLGNSYFKLGKIGLAYAFLQKAYALSPEVETIRHNLNLVEGEILKTSLLVNDRSLWLGKIIPLSKKIGLNLFLLIFSFASIVSLVFLFFKRAFHQRFTLWIRDSSILAVFLFWISTTTIVIIGVAALSSTVFVVQAEKTSARSGPGEVFIELFTLNAGNRVLYRDEAVNHWVKIRFSLGNTAWIMEKDLLEL